MDNFKYFCRSFFCFPFPMLDYTFVVLFKWGVGRTEPLLTSQDNEYVRFITYYNEYVSCICKHLSDYLKKQLLNYNNKHYFTEL